MGVTDGVLVGVEEGSLEGVSVGEKDGILLGRLDGTSEGNEDGFDELLDLLPDLLLDLCRSIAMMDSFISNGAKDGCPLGYKVSTFLSKVPKFKFNMPVRVSFLISTMLPVRDFSIRLFRSLWLFPCELSPLCSKELIERLTFCSLAATVVETIRSNA